MIGHPTAIACAAGNDDNFEMGASMAGPFGHMVSRDGRLLELEEFVETIDNPGDVYGMVEEMLGMIWHLANRVAQATGEDPAAIVEGARAQLEDGCE
ncbi:hypothetical protein [Rhodococcus sp. NPDC059234]|uniref:hypothetical protein n=1 Tax=Rhodococcus sp. NPDC059234 TaxID=3346781 RepID=UPI00367077F3